MSLPYREISEEYQRIFAIGDLHGCVRELDLLLSYLTLELGIGSGDLVVFLGDYVDRGPDPRGVLDRLLSFRSGPAECVFLMGNHEQMLGEFLAGRLPVDDPFVRRECRTTFRSYRCSPAVARDEFLDLLPETHLEFFEKLERMIVTPKFVFAHAGLHPARDLETQRNEDLFWIREPFISSPHEFGQTVVYGHTPYQDVMLDLPFKIGIDTGVVFGNLLTCVELVGGERFQVKKDDDEVRRSLLLI